MRRPSPLTRPRRRPAGRARWLLRTATARLHRLRRRRGARKGRRRRRRRLCRCVPRLALSPPRRKRLVLPSTPSRSVLFFSRPRVLPLPQLLLLVACFHRSVMFWPRSRFWFDDWKRNATLCSLEVLLFFVCSFSCPTNSQNPQSLVGSVYYVVL